MCHALFTFPSLGFAAAVPAGAVRTRRKINDFSPRLPEKRPSRYFRAAASSFNGPLSASRVTPGGRIRCLTGRQTRRSSPLMRVVLVASLLACASARVAQHGERYRTINRGPRTLECNGVRNAREKHSPPEASAREKSVCVRGRASEKQRGPRGSYLVNRGGSTRFSRKIKEKPKEERKREKKNINNSNNTRPHLYIAVRRARHDASR